MSRLDKLLVRGIRSYDPQQAAVIEFYSPLTLIVGRNGCGKTTIIESMKYATTGEMPPNSKGGAFIHDPKIAVETVTKGQVRLKFRNTAGQQLVCTRNVQLTQKKGSNSTKNLDCVLEATDSVTGEVRSITSKCADMDAEIPIQLGVEKAILDDVVFCHQEESNWPLSDTQTLKKKLDRIFGSEKWRELLVELRRQAKSNDQEHKLVKKDFEFLKIEVERGRKLEKSIREREEKLQELESMDAQLEVKMRQVTEKLQNLNKDATERTEREFHIAKLETERSLLKNAVDELERDLGDLVSDDDPQVMLESLRKQQARVANASELKKELSAEQITIARSLDMETNRLQTLSSKRGQIEGLVGQIDDKSKSIQLLLGRLGVRCVDQAETRLNELKSSCEETKRRFRADEEARSIQVQSRLKVLAALQESCRNLQRVRMDSNAKVKQLTTEVSALADDTSVEDAQAELRRAKSDLEIAQKRLDEAKTLEASTKARISCREKELREKRESLREECRVATQAVQASAEVTVKRKDLNAKVGIFEDLSSKLSQNGVQDIQSVYAQKEAELGDAENEAKAVSAALSALKTKNEMETKQLEDTREKLRSLSLRLDSKLRVLSRDTDTSDIQEMIEDCESALLRWREESSTIGAVCGMYEKYLKSAQQQHKCPLCKRGFEQASEEGKFVAKLEGLLAKAPGRAEELRNQISTAEERLATLSTLRPDWEQTVKLRDTEIPELEKIVEATRKQISAKAVADENVHRRVDQLRSDRERLTTELKWAERLKGVEREVDDLRRQLEILEAKAGTHVRSLEEINEESDKIEGQILLGTSELMRVNISISSKVTNLQHCLSRVQAAAEEERKLAEQATHKRELQQKIEEAQKSAESTSRELAKQKEHVEKAGEESEEGQRDLAALKAHHQLLETQKLTEIQAYERPYVQLQDLQAEIDRQLGPNGDALQVALRGNADEIKSSQATIDACSQRKDAIAAEIASLDRGMTELEHTQRRIHQNIKLRQKKEGLSLLVLDLQKARRELQSRFPDIEQLQTRDLASEVQATLNRLGEERGAVRGQLGQLKDQVGRDKGEYKEDYATKEQQLMDCLGKRITLEAVTKDIHVLTRSLDMAIMEHHRLMMQEINECIGELWMNTYQNSDIERIEIRSDKDTSTATSGIRYSYRVVMFKGNCELDMRGRCSAGQKVLASIIIRIALSEAFGIKCGILALDEPTTNLDRENMEALAQSLANLIKIRKEQSNFQLLVITHDENFVSRLREAGTGDYYWRVRMDDNGHSRIERHRM